LLNRTVLFQFVEQNRFGNTFEACQEIMPLNPEIPRFEDWSERLGIQDGDIIPLELQNPRLLQFDSLLRVVMGPQLTSAFPLKIKAYRRKTCKGNPMEKEYRAYLEELWKADPIYEQKAVQFFALGALFTNGLLFRNIFTLPKDVGVVVSTSPNYHLPVSSDSSFSLALHSRHPVRSDNGTLIPEESECLVNLLSGTNLTTACTVYLMSDRPPTIRLLTEFLHQHFPHCRVITALQEDHAEETSREHGPSPGNGFMLDLAVAQRARSAFVGSDRSSSLLLHELMIYGRYMDEASRVCEWRLFNHKTVTIPWCQLSKKDEKGYSYGPGAPIFTNGKRQIKYLL